MLADQRPPDPELNLPDEAYEWLYAIVTDEAKQAPDWRAKARTGRGSFMASPEADLQSLPHTAQSC